MKTSEIRQAFLDYFAKHGHHVVPSSSLVPTNDPTLLFTNAGMNQFKGVFLGEETRPYSMATSAQRCVRAGGKHNDLENVGYTARHHTFFEMLGNFSFGDYFKREAIGFAWTFLTDVLKLPKERLWITVFKDDDEAADIWLKEIGVSPLRFSRCGEKDNFWTMGDTGPCGPCTEIFYDHGPEIAGGPPGSADGDLDRYIEIWNLVFMQFNRDKSGQLHPLPKPSVDTGMGLERIAAVVQGVHNNYEIDDFKYLINAILKLSRDLDPHSPSLKVIADHIRACAFLIADGVIPSNEGRGYVLRRIIRRAVRHGNKLGLLSPFFHQLVQPLVDIMGAAYPELTAMQTQIEQILLQEENQFTRTLELGLKLLQGQIQTLNGQEISGDVVFKLYDTYGFPVDLTADIAREQGLTVDMEGFEFAMQQQRAQSQQASQFAVDYSSAKAIDVQSAFYGYEHQTLESSIVAILVDNQPIERLTAQTKATIVLDNTPFYAESGGQVGDSGVIKSLGANFRVDDTQKIKEAIVHYGELLSGEFTLNQQVVAQIDEERRAAIRLNHTATHLLHAALKIVLGPHVQQKGSLVDMERARFDFSHQTPLSASECSHIETLVNDQIRSNVSVDTALMSIEEAKLAGAMALFGEKYTETVRVLSVGDFSKELCGGTHATRTGDIGLFKITAEYGVASGVRRIEFVTGRYALQWLHKQEALIEHLAAKLRSTPDHVIEKITQLIEDLKQQEKELSRLKAGMLSGSLADIIREVRVVNGIELLVKRLDQLDAQGLRAMLDELKSRLEKVVVVLFSVNEDKINVVAGVSKSLLGHVPSAATLVKHLCGKGGGRDDMAQGGGAVPGDLETKIAEIEELVSKF
jgi:alanyl-tRNA synthetase